jgi:hypothetical protein
MIQEPLLLNLISEKMEARPVLSQSRVLESNTIDKSKDKNVTIQLILQFFIRETQY